MAPRWYYFCTKATQGLPLVRLVRSQLDRPISTINDSTSFLLRGTGSVLQCGRGFMMFLVFVGSQVPHVFHRFVIRDSHGPF
jgi:hypothetical protein